jgi:hypothetical protein
MAAHAPRASSPASAYPVLWRCVLIYEVVVVVFVIVVVVLVAHGCPFPIAVGVPATLSTVAVRAIVRLAEASRLSLPA